MSNATFTVVCYKSKTLANGEHPLMLRVSKDGKKSYRSLGISINPKHWSFTKNSPKSSCPNREQIQKLIISKLAEMQKRVLELNAENKDYTTTSLIKGNSTDTFTPKTVGEFYEELIAEYSQNEKYGNRLIYKGSYNSLRTFNKGKLDILFNQITEDWLIRYEKWLRSKGNKETTISLLFRTLRSAYNKAIQSKCARKSDYPFDNYKINKFSTKTEKRAIAKNDILKIQESNIPCGKRLYMELSRDLFMFSYLCGGINFTDMANLTNDNIVNGRIKYIRQKTHKPISLGLCDEAMSIIAKYSTNNNGYIFPILDKAIHKTALQKQNRIHKILVKVNANLKLIAQDLNIEANMTTYVARHSFASVLKKSGTNIAIISEALGHSDLSTTQIYLDSFDNEQIDNAMKNLL